jgi:sugar phosphate isomerase/epimerase
MSQLTRRKFLAGSAALGVAAGVSGFGSCPIRAAEPLVKGTPNADKLGWRVGFSAYSFRALTLYEALDKIAATGLHWVELFAWQKLSPAHPEATPSASLSDALRKELKKKAADSGVKMIGVYSGLDNLETAKGMFAMAAEMGFEVIVSEPPESMFDAVEALTEEYKVSLALHNHPKPSHYWNPETAMAALKGRSERMGLCGDTGHWCRCGLEPAEVLRKVGSRIKTFHMKDLDAFGVPGAKDVIWGQGKGRIAEIMAEIKRQGVKPYFGIEWERTADSEPSLHAESVAFFEKTAQALAAS